MPVSRERVLEAYNLACIDYNAQRLSFWEGMIHSQVIDRSVRRFGEQLTTQYNLSRVCGDRIASHFSMWNSNRSKSFNSHFLRHLKRLEPWFYKVVVGRGRNLVFLEGQDVILYRSDTRSPVDILREGFRPWRAMESYSHRDGYSDKVNYQMGISTTKRKYFINDWGGTVYKIRFKAGSINDGRLIGVDIVETQKRKQSCHCEDCIRGSAAEVNFITAIPPEFIEGYYSGSRLVPNAGYTGKFSVPMVLPRLSSEVMPVPDVDDESVAAAAATEVREAHLPAAIGYKAGDSIRIGKYSCDIQLYRGTKGRVHCVFSEDDSAKRFIKGENLIGDRDPSKLKQADPRRYSGLFAVRISSQAYTRLQTSMPVLPKEDELPVAPAFGR